MEASRGGCSLLNVEDDKAECMCTARGLIAVITIPFTAVSKFQLKSLFLTFLIL
jgi:hypothetical protein